MSVVKQQVPGTIYALNEDTGVYMFVREAMLKDRVNYNFRRANIGDEKLPQSTPDEIAAPVLPDVIMTKANKPFKTEQSAKNAMRAQELDENEYIVMPLEDGFIITKV